MTKKLITDYTEIQGISKIDRHTHPWQKTTLLTDKAVHLSTTKVDVFSDSVLCLGKKNPYPESKTHGKEDCVVNRHPFNIENWIESTGSQLELEL